MGFEQTQDAILGNQSGTVAIMDAIGKATARLDEMTSEMVKAKDEDTSRWTALNAERQTQAATLTELQAAFQKARMDEETKAAVEGMAELKAQLGQMRAPSKAGVLSSGRTRRDGYAPGAFISAIIELANRDPDVYRAAKATLESLSEREEAWGKATIGTTDATGGWIIPNAIVDDVIIPASIENIYRGLMTTVTGVTAAAVDLPFRNAVRARAIIAAANSLKENVDLAYQGYTVTMYTLARIYDVANQFLRQSRGAAERDVMNELAAAFAQGESYYIREGSGSSEPFGYTSALTNGPGTFRSSFSPSATTLAGSIAKAVATAAGALAGRGVRPTAAVLSAASYWNMVSQGTDTAGFFFSPAGGPNDIRPGTLMSPFGLPVYADPGADLQATAAVTDNLVVADWKRFKLYFGQSYRVDSSDQANTRWDYNLTGFRGEEEMGFDARPTVYAGYAQMITDIEP